MKLTDFDYYLPIELIAQEPLPERDSSKLLVLHRRDGKMEDRIFKDVIDYLTPDDTLVLNDTKVFPARLFGIDRLKNKKIEILLNKIYQEQIWEVLIRAAKKIKVGTKLYFGDNLEGELIDKKGSRGYIKFEYEGEFFKVLESVGKTPLPPYIKREAMAIDVHQYQTVYARKQGAIAAPTAGLHFTKDLLKKISDKGVKITFITLHVGVGTFSPIRKEYIIDHQMEEEYYEISRESAEIINQTKGKIAVVGTTTVRALETEVRRQRTDFGFRIRRMLRSKISDFGFEPRIPNLDSQALSPEPRAPSPEPRFWTESKGQVSAGFTDLFIYPGFEFRITDMLITNFHLPKTTLLLLVSAFAGREKILSTYQHAINKRYRFYSYGDAMLIV